MQGDLLSRLCETGHAPRVGVLDIAVGQKVAQLAAAAGRGTRLPFFL